MARQDLLGNGVELLCGIGIYILVAKEAYKVRQGILAYECFSAPTGAYETESASAVAGHPVDDGPVLALVPDSFCCLAP